MSRVYVSNCEWKNSFHMCALFLYVSLTEKFSFKKKKYRIFTARVLSHFHWGKFIILDTVKCNDLAVRAYNATTTICTTCNHLFVENASSNYYALSYIFHFHWHTHTFFLSSCAAHIFWPNFSQQQSSWHGNERIT